MEPIEMVSYGNVRCMVYTNYEEILEEYGRVLAIEQRLRVYVEWGSVPLPHKLAIFETSPENEFLPYECAGKKHCGSTRPYNMRCISRENCKSEHCVTFYCRGSRCRRNAKEQTHFVIVVLSTDDERVLFGQSTVISLQRTRSSDLRSKRKSAGDLEDKPRKKKPRSSSATLPSSVTTPASEATGPSEYLPGACSSAFPSHLAPYLPSAPLPVAVPSAPLPVVMPSAPLPVAVPSAPLPVVVPPSVPQSQYIPPPDYVSQGYPSGCFIPQTNWLAQPSATYSPPFPFLPSPPAPQPLFTPRHSSQPAPPPTIPLPLLPYSGPTVSSIDSSQPLIESFKESISHLFLTGSDDLAFLLGGSNGTDQITDPNLSVATTDRTEPPAEPSSNNNITEPAVLSLEPFGDDTSFFFDYLDSGDTTFL
eukprot:TRINITY_DN91_c0_g1_i1.p1 TRINITY_DN91_c0_g1~~TRINITY_DN91_c0_g1_i1.p1  ORF type:complete len:420 (-),score=45.93 TRINITY_DN91_c0_g1_i1:60-1319(-)